MVQPYLPCDKALLHLWQGTKAINQLLANNLLAPPCVFVRLFVCVAKVAEDPSLAERYHLPYHTLQGRDTQNRPTFKHACLFALCVKCMIHLSESNLFNVSLKTHTGHEFLSAKVSISWVLSQITWLKQNQAADIGPLYSLLIFCLPAIKESIVGPCECWSMLPTCQVPLSRVNGRCSLMLPFFSKKLHCVNEII